MTTQNAWHGGCKREGNFIKHMKTSLKVIALLLAAGFPCVAFAEMLGVSVPAIANVENVVIVFSSAVFGLTLVTDYTRRSRMLTAVTPADVPAARTPRENHRLAA